MQLTDERRQALKAILIQIFGEDFRHIKPTHRTLEITEKMLLEMHKCNDRIQRLFKSLHCANITRAFLTRCLKAVRDIIKNDPPEFRGCTKICRSTHINGPYMPPECKSLPYH